jgi:hypothetical protein
MVEDECTMEGAEKELEEGKVSLCPAVWNDIRFSSGHTSRRISLCRRTPRLILHSVIQIIMMIDPTMYPCAQASRISPSGSVGLVTSVIRRLNAWIEVTICGAMLFWGYYPKYATQDTAKGIQIPSCMGDQRL